MNKYIHDAHSIYLCDYHIVMCTKYRRQVINKGFGTYLSNKAYEVTKHYPKLRIKEFNYEKDHIHMLVSIPPSMSVGSFIRLYKTNSSRKVKEQFSFLKKVYWGTDSLWSGGYFASTVGVNEAIIRKYIQNQGEEDAGRTATLFD
jgi:putative transposase